eukprot:9447848-Alexandrium_andersonii.AAC.1
MNARMRFHVCASGCVRVRVRAFLTARGTGWGCVWAYGASLLLHLCFLGEHGRASRLVVALGPMSGGLV